MDDKSSIRDWFAQWSGFVAAVDFDSARALFLPTVIGFGTYKDAVHGLDRLEAEQWRSIWPTIRDFSFDLDSLEVLMSPDGQQGVALIGWDSTGIDEDGQPYPRPGRATVVLNRVGDAWLGAHTHLSVCPAERKMSFGDSAT